MSQAFFLTSLISVASSGDNTLDELGWPAVMLRKRGHGIRNQKGKVKNLNTELSFEVACKWTAW